MKIYLNTDKNYVWIEQEGNEMVQIKGTPTIDIVKVLIKFLTTPTYSKPKKREEVIDYSKFKRSA